MFNSNLASQYNSVLGDYVHMATESVLAHIIKTTGSLTVSQSFVYAVQILLGNTIPRLILVSGIASLMRWLIKKGMGA